MKTNLKTLTVLVAVVLLLGLSGVVAHAGGLVDIPFDPDNNFPTPPAINDINNQYWTLYTQDLGERTFLYYTMPKVGDGCEVNYVWVKDQTVMIAGLKAWEVQDWVYADDDCSGGPDFVNSDPVLLENTLDWYAQDDDGNVWYLGEWTEEYEYDNQGNLVNTSTEGSWKTGVDDAEPGPIMLADPSPGDFYQQEYLADHAEDLAKVLRVNARVELTFNEDNPNDINPGEYGDCLKTKEWSPLELGVVEHKYYCDGLFLLGNELQGGTVRTELVDIMDGPPPVDFTPPILTPAF